MLDLTSSSRFSATSNTLDIYQTFLLDASDTKFAFKQALDAMSLSDLIGSIDKFLQSLNFNNWEEGEARVKQIQVFLTRLKNSSSNGVGALPLMKNAIYNQLIYLCTNLNERIVTNNSLAEVIGNNLEQKIEEILKDSTLLSNLQINEPIYIKILENGASRAHIMSILEVAIDLHKWCLGLPNGVKIADYILGYLPEHCLELLNNSQNQENKHVIILNLNDKIEAVVSYCNKLTENTQHKTCLSLYSFLQVVCLGGENRDRLAQFIAHKKISRIEIIKLYKALILHLIQGITVSVQVIELALADNDNYDNDWKNSIEEVLNGHTTVTSSFIGKFSELNSFLHINKNMDEMERLEFIGNSIIQILDFLSQDNNITNLDLLDVEFLSCIESAKTGGFKILFSLIMYEKLLIHLEENDFISIKQCAELIDIHELLLHEHEIKPWKESLVERLNKIQNQYEIKFNINQGHIDWGTFDIVILNLSRIIDNLVFGVRAITKLNAVECISNLLINFNMSLIDYLSGPDYKDLAAIKQFGYPNVLKYLNCDDKIVRCSFLDAPYKRVILQLSRANSNLTTLFGRTTDQVQKFLLACKKMPFLVSLPLAHSIPLFFEHKEKLCLIHKLVSKYRKVDQSFILKMITCINNNELKKLDRDLITGLGLERCFLYMKQFPNKYNLVLDIERLYGFSGRQLLKLFNSNENLLHLLINDHLVIKYLIFTKSLLCLEDIIHYESKIQGWRFLVKLGSAMIKGMPNSDAAYQQLRKILTFERSRFFNILDDSFCDYGLKLNEDCDDSMLYGMVCLIYKNLCESAKCAIDDPTLQSILHNFIQFYKVYKNNQFQDLSYLHVVMAFETSMQYFQNSDYNYFIYFISKLVNHKHQHLLAPKAMKDMALKASYLKAGMINLNEIAPQDLIEIVINKEFEEALRLLSSLNYSVICIDWDNEEEETEKLNYVRKHTIATATSFKVMNSTLNALDLKWHNAKKRLGIFSLEEQVRLVKFLDSCAKLVKNTPDQLLTIIYNQVSVSQGLLSWLLSDNSILAIKDAYKSIDRVLEWKEIKELYSNRDQLQRCYN